MQKKFTLNAQKKKQERDEQLKKDLAAIPEIDEEKAKLVINSTVTQLVDMLNQDKVTSEELFNIFYKRSATVGAELNLITEGKYQESLELAKNCDKIRKGMPPEDRQNKLGPIFGIPFSIKDNFIEEGLDCSIGSAARIYQPFKEDGAIVKVLKEAGAIPVLRSNVPQTMLITDCVNPIWGRSMNPWANDRTVGGSSGGAGGLLAAKCIPICLGSDYLGSIRIPAAFCGVYGFKPTNGVVPLKGQTVTSDFGAGKFSPFYVNHGPLGLCTDDCVLFTKALMHGENNRKYEPLFPSIKWNDEKYKSVQYSKGLKIAYLETAEIFGASSGIKNVIREAADQLKKDGHEVIKADLPQLEELVLITGNIVSSEGGAQDYKETLRGEKPVDELKYLISLQGLGNCIRSLATCCLGCNQKKNGRIIKLLKNTKSLSASQLLKKITRLLELRDEVIDYFVSQKIDGLILPSMPMAAFKHGMGKNLSVGALYNWLAVVTNMPAGTMPIRKTKSEEANYDIKDAVHPDDFWKFGEKSQQGSEGMPLSIQVLTLPYEDEKCCGIMKILENSFKFYERPENPIQKNVQDDKKKK